MRWKKKVRPSVGARRIYKAFLLFPKRIGQETRWLEIAHWLEVYIDYGSTFEHDYYWEPTKWLDTEKERADG